ncbi:MAG: hypothetical protein O3B04_08360 [Chloroflexi bacterium]|nr:hypothetical protein [Chloroflexota bacterium]
MPLSRLLAVSLISIVAVIVSACGSSGEIPEADSVDSLGVALQAAGLRVKGPLPNDVLSSRYFSIPGVQFDASGEQVLAYEFENDEELAAQRGLVSPDGWGIGPKYIQWRTEPSYFQNGRLIVIYDGDKALVIETLAAAMGEPFVTAGPV